MVCPDALPSRRTGEMATGPDSTDPHLDDGKVTANSSRPNADGRGSR
jgi:hypothetical protein